MQSLREKLWGKTKPLREKLIDVIAPASVMSYSAADEKRVDSKDSAQSVPLLKAEKKPKQKDEVKVEDGALIPNGADKKTVPPNNAVKIKAEDDVPEGSGNVERVGSDLYHTPRTDSYVLKDRGVMISKEDIEKSLKPMLYSEAAPHGEGRGQRPKEKVELEMRAIMNTVFNRSKNRQKTVSEIINEPNQYQGVTSKKFKNFATTTDPIEKQQIDFINETFDKIVSEIQNGTFQDNVGGAEFYGHLKDGTIRAFDTWEEYAEAIDAGLVK